MSRFKNSYQSKPVYSGIVYKNLACRCKICKDQVFANYILILFSTHMLSILKNSEKN
jgi:hypothetical protein